MFPTSTGSLAACDLAVVQGGLTTAMELTAARSARSCTSRCATTSSSASTSTTGSSATARAAAWRSTADIAAAIAEEIGRPVAYRTVERDGAERAAALIAELL